MHDFVIEAPTHMTQSAHSACVRCREHLLKGCGRTDGFWQGLRKNCQRGFHKIAHSAFARKPSVRPPPGIKPKPAGSDHQSNAATVNFGSTDARRTQRAYGARFESATRCLEQREADADITPANAARWLAEPL